MKKKELTKEQIFILISLISQELISYNYIDKDKEIAGEWRDSLAKIKEDLKTFLPETYKLNK